MSAVEDPEVALRELLGRIAPGTALRDGLERILAGRTGALIVLGYDRVVESLCTGGFALDVALSATRLRELAKMDGAVIVSYDGTRIVRAGVHLMPDPTIPTEESGTRHRTAERVARQIDVPVISVSEAMSVVTIYRDDLKYTLEPIPRVLAKANQALQTLERYKDRLDAVSGSLSALEVEDLVTVRDSVTVLQRAEMVRRIADEIEGYIVELGSEGRLVLLQLEELMGGVEDDRRLVAKDYFVASVDWELEEVMKRLAQLTTDELLDLKEVAAVLHLPQGTGLDWSLQPHGYRLLHKIPRLPEIVADRVVARFASLQKIMRASMKDLDEVEGVGETRARAIKEGLSRLAETSILDRYV